MTEKISTVPIKKSNLIPRGHQQYHDYSNVIEDELGHAAILVYQQEPRSPAPTKESHKKVRRGPRGGVPALFPVKLHRLLEEGKYPDIISWQPHGRCFLLRKPHEFVTKVMTKYFKQTKLTSFQRQLNMYAFRRISSGPEKGAYYHELFLRGKDKLCTHMVRMRVKGTKIKSASCPESEPNFYTMPALKKQDPQQQTPPSVAEAVSEDETVSSQNENDCDSKTASCNGSTTGSLISDHSCASDYTMSSSSEKVERLKRLDRPLSHTFLLPLPLPQSTSPSPSPSPPPPQVSPLVQAQVSVPLSVPSKVISNNHTINNIKLTTFEFDPPMQSILQNHQAPSSLPEPKAVTFEGKGFYYLDPFDHWDACTLPLGDDQYDTDTDLALVGLSTDPYSGELCGFEI